MSLENYAIHIAPRGGKIDLLVDEFEAKRQVASDTRWAYARSKGAIGLYQNEHSVSGLVFLNEESIPNGWAKEYTIESGVVASPKSKDRTKEARLLTKTIKAELAALPRLVGADEFTGHIGSAKVLSTPETGRGFCLRSCIFERIGETTFIMTPWVTKQEETGNLDDDAKTKTAFLPEGCERVGLSVYYAAKEKVEGVMV